MFLDPLMVISEELWNISILQEYTDLPNNIAGFKFLSQIFSPEYFVNKIGQYNSKNHESSTINPRLV